MSNFNTPVSKTAFEESTASIYPNPTKGDFTLSLELETPATLKIEIYNVLGVKTIEMNEATQSVKFTKEFTLENYPNGVYNVRISTGEQQWNMKVVKY